MTSVEAGRLQRICAALEKTSDYFVAETYTTLLANRYILREHWAFVGNVRRAVIGEVEDILLAFAASDQELRDATTQLVRSVLQRYADRTVATQAEIYGRREVLLAWASKPSRVFEALVAIDRDNESDAAATYRNSAVRMAILVVASDQLASPDERIAVVRFEKMLPGHSPSGR